MGEKKDGLQHGHTSQKKLMSVVFSSSPPSIPSMPDIGLEEDIRLHRIGRRVYIAFPDL